MSTTTIKRSYVGVLVAVIALCLALGGTALADSSPTSAEAGALSKSQVKSAKAPGVSKAQVKRLAKKIANKQIKKKAPKLTVKHAKSADTAASATKATTADSALTAGSAATAGSAVSAQFAASAGKIGELEVKKFSKQVATDGATIELINLAGFVVKASCPAGIPTINGSGNGGKLRFQSISSGDTINQNGTSNLSLAGLTMTSGQDLGSGYAEYGSPTDRVASVWYGWRSDAGTCFFFGNAIGG